MSVEKEKHDYHVTITVEANGKTVDEFNAFLASIQALLSQERVDTNITGSKLTVDKNFASLDWHDGLQ